jgi:hypothetical protein
MSIREITEKIKGRLGEREVDLFILCFIVLAGLLAYGLWQLTELEGERMPVQIRPASQMASVVSTSIIAESGEGKYVASRSGKKYHRPDCGGAKQIKEENKIWFETAAAAQAAGYTPAANCPGLSK